MAKTVHISDDGGDSVLCGVNIYSIRQWDDRDVWSSKDDWNESGKIGKEWKRCKNCDLLVRGVPMADTLHSAMGIEMSIKPIHAADMDFGSLLGYLHERCRQNLLDAARTDNDENLVKVTRVYTLLDLAIKAYTGK